MKIERKRFVVMRKNRTEIWGGCARNFEFRPIGNIGEFAIKTYRTEKQALSSCSSWDRDFEVVPITETISDQSEGEWLIKRHPLLGDYDITCSSCGRKERRGQVWSESWGISNFCPDCGAKMKGGAK